LRTTWVMKRKGRPGRSSEAASQVHQSNFRFRNRERRLRLEPRNRAGHAAQSVARRLPKLYAIIWNKHRSRRPSAWSYSLTVVIAFAAPNGCSLLTTILPLGAMKRSSGLRSGCLTLHDGSIRRLESNARMVLSPSPSGPMPEASKSLASVPNAKPCGNGTTWS
jgi:hypothetical protein